MSEIDWRDIALVIREGRFKDVTQDVWDKVADKVETLANKKRGRPRKPVWTGPLSKQNCDRFFKESVAWAIKNVDPTEMSRRYEIEDCFYNLTEQGMKSGEAIEEVAAMFNIGVKSIETTLTALRKNRKFEQEEQEAIEKIS